MVTHPKYEIPYKVVNIDFVLCNPPPPTGGAYELDQPEQIIESSVFPRDFIN